MFEETINYFTKKTILINNVLWNCFKNVRIRLVLKTNWISIESIKLMFIDVLLILILTRNKWLNWSVHCRVYAPAHNWYTKYNYDAFHNQFVLICHTFTCVALRKHLKQLIDFLHVNSMVTSHNLWTSEHI